MSTASKEKRARIMARSRKLGHCICNPKQPCPCDVFKQHGICPCAGERPSDVSPSDIRLTRLVRNAGCASKIPPKDLGMVLSRLPVMEDPRLLVGTANADDAGVYELESGECLVQTVDLFTPCVDDPYLFGQIVAANSLSDVYAMGGRPLLALSIIGFPIDTLSHEIMARVLEGGLDKIREAGALVVGGHSIKDEEVKFGFALTGLVSKENIVTNSGARPGDLLVLTKPLGTGLVSFAAQVDKGSPEAMETAAKSMARLNRTASEKMIEAGAHACTDVTGFGLLGHLFEMLQQGGHAAEVWWDCLPSLPRALDLAREDIIGGGVERNREFIGDRVLVTEDTPREHVILGLDPQTSGGLLIALSEDRASGLIQALQAAGEGTARIIGKIVSSAPHPITIRHSRKAAAASRLLDDFLREETPLPSESPVPACCPEGQVHAERLLQEAEKAEDAGEGIMNVRNLFGKFMGGALAEGSLDERTKEIVLLSMAILTRCEVCVKMHVPKALRMGFTRDQIEEAASIAIAMGGAPVLTYWQEASTRLFT